MSCRLDGRYWIESGRVRFCLIHIRAAERTLLCEAAGRPNPELLTKPSRNDLTALAAEASG